MAKYYFLLLLSIFNFTSISQSKFHITPFIGHGTPLASSKKSLQKVNTPNNDIDFTYPITDYQLLTPLTFGIKFEYQKNKHQFSLGIIGGDLTGSTIDIRYTTKSNSGIYQNKRAVRQSTWVGGSMTKVPLTYNFKLITKQHFQKKQNTFFTLKLHTGINIIKTEKWTENSFDDMKVFDVDGNDSWMIQPLTTSNTLYDGNKIDIVAWESNLNKVWSVSFDLGFNIDWYVKNKRRIVTSIYYEQGTRHLSAVIYELYYNNNLLGMNAAYSRGSAIQFKLMFPIGLRNLEE